MAACIEHSQVHLALSMATLVVDEGMLPLKNVSMALFGALLEKDALASDSLAVPAICQWLLDLNRPLAELPACSLRVLISLASRVGEQHQPRELLHLVGAIPGLLERKLEVLPCVAASARRGVP